MKNYLDSLIRTFVPIIIGPVLLWASTKLGTDLSHLEAEAVVAISGLVTAAYYALIRALERKYPSIGWLLGKPGAPTYGDLEVGHNPA